MYHAAKVSMHSQPIDTYCGYVTCRLNMTCTCLALFISIFSPAMLSLSTLLVRITANQGKSHQVGAVSFTWSRNGYHLAQLVRDLQAQALLAFAWLRVLRSFVSG